MGRGDRGVSVAAGVIDGLRRRGVAAGDLPSWASAASPIASDEQLLAQAEALSAEPNGLEFPAGRGLNVLVSSGDHATPGGKRLRAHVGVRVNTLGITEFAAVQEAGPSQRLRRSGSLLSAGTDLDVVLEAVRLRFATMSSLFALLPGTGIALIDRRMIADAINARALDDTGHTPPA